MVNPEEDLDSHSKREKLEERKGVHVLSLSGTSPNVISYTRMEAWKWRYYSYDSIWREFRDHSDPENLKSLPEKSIHFIFQTAFIFLNKGKLRGKFISILLARCGGGGMT